MPLQTFIIKFQLAWNVQLMISVVLEDIVKHPYVEVTTLSFILCSLLNMCSISQNICFLQLQSAVAVIMHALVMKDVQPDVAPVN